MNIISVYTLTALIMLSGITLAQPGREKESSAFLMQDYTLVSTWDAIANGWNPTVRQVAVYNERNRLIESVAINAQTNDTISKTTSIYNESGRVIIQLFQEWREGNWFDIRYLLLDYDENNRRASVTTYIWSAEEWVFSTRARHFNLIYDDHNRLLSYESQYWIDGEWQTSAIDYNEYDEKGDLAYQFRKLMPSMQYSYRVYYTYFDNKMLTRHVQSYNRNSNEWINSYSDHYQYNQCGLRTDFVRQRFIGGNWINSQKTEYFYRVFFPYGTAQRDRKVAICHNGQTIYVSENALTAHLAHGDCLGACPIEKTPPGKLKSEGDTPQFTIYPNPARENVTLSFEDIAREENVRRIELSDSFGKRIRSYNVSGQSEYVIQRGNLLPGTYYVKLVGNRTEYTGIVIFE